MSTSGRFAYDGLGQRTQHWNSQLGASVKETTNYDARGRVSLMVDLGGDTTTYTYLWDSSIATSGSDTYVTTAHNDYNAYDSSAGTYTGVYQGGVVTHSSSTTNTKDTDGTLHFVSSDDTVNAFTWWDDAEQASTAVATHYPGGGNDTDFTSTYSYDALGNLTTVSIQDGRPRTVFFLTNAQGEIIQRDEADANASTGDPRQVYYFFEGTRVGDISNDGTSDTDYATSIASHTTAAPTTPGPFRNGAASGTSYADFDQSYDPINGLNYDSTAGRYTVQDGDTLESIAQTVWGDASLWYMLADANGLDGTETLVSGRDLIVPNKIANIHNNASTYKVYDPNDAIGNTAPTDPKPSKHHSNHCGVFGQILLVAIAVAVTAITYGSLGGTALQGLAAVEAGAEAGVAGSVVSQGVGLATGLQDNFSFTGVALSAIAGGVGAGIGSSIGNIGGSPFLGHVVTGALGDAATQGIALATGLQSHFSWSEIAAAGLADGVGDAVGHDIFHVAAGARPNFGQTLVEGTAGAIAGAAERSLLTGSDFGDNIMRTLPSVLGQTIGNLAADGIASSGDPKQQAQSQFTAADTGTRSDVPTPVEEAFGDIVVTARKAGHSFLDWVDGWTGFNLGGHNPHRRAGDSAGGFTFWQPGVQAGSGYDRMGQSLTGRSNYNSFSQFTNILSDAHNVSFRTTLERLGEWSTYSVPDASLINATIADPYNGMASADRVMATQLDRLTSGTVSGITTGISLQMGADATTQDLLYGLGSAGDGFLIAGGGMAGAQVPGIGNQLELNIVNGENGINANSRLSGRTTYLYELYHDDGTFLKYGISVNPDARYSNSFMKDKALEPITSGTRADMLILERQMVIANPGLLNNEPWAVKARTGN